MKVSGEAIGKPPGLSRLLLQVFFGVNERKFCYERQDRPERVRL